MLLLWVALRLVLPKSYGDSKIKYSESLKSMAVLIRRFPLLRESSIVGAMGIFGIQCILDDPYFFYYKVRIIIWELMWPDYLAWLELWEQLFSRSAGKLSDKKGARFTVGINIVVIVLAYVILGIFRSSFMGDLLWALFLLDLGVQSCNVSNQTRIHQLSEDARNRITAIYMVSYFIGGSLGSWLGTFSFQHFGWIGVCIVGLASPVDCQLCAYKRKQEY